MFNQEFTTETQAVRNLALVDLRKPANFPQVLEFIAHTASPCVADALANSFANDLVNRTGCARQVALAHIHKMVQVFG